MRFLYVARISRHDFSIESGELTMPMSCAVVAAFDGRYLVRGGTMETLAGDIEDRRAVVEFPDMDRARTFYESPGYRDARKHLGDAIMADMFLLEGFKPDRAPHSGS